jgi:hypothetical protein
MNTPELKVKISKIKSNFFLKIRCPQTGEFLGRLFEKDGKLYFEGKADESAKVFFNQMVKEYSLMKKNSEMLEMLEYLVQNGKINDKDIIGNIKNLIKEAKNL